MGVPIAPSGQLLFSPDVYHLMLWDFLPPSLPLMALSVPRFCLLPAPLSLLLLGLLAYAISWQMLLKGNYKSSVLLSLILHLKAQQRHK